MTVRVRAGTPTDIDPVVVIENDSFPDPWSYGLLLEVLRGGVPSARCLVAEVEATVVGAAIVSVVTEDAELQRIAVDPGWRRTGVASTLLDAVLDLAAAGGAERLLLEVRESNAAALAFYTVRGFTELGRRPRYYFDGSTAVVMAHTLR